MDTFEKNISVVQYDYHFIMSLRNTVSNRLPEHIFKKVISYKRTLSSRRGNNYRRSTKVNRFIMSRNPDNLDIEELQNEVKKNMRGLLNKVTRSNLGKMKDKINEIINLLNKVKNPNNKFKVHKSLMIILLNKAIVEKSYLSLYAIILQDIIKKVNLDYREYIDNLFIDMKKANMKNNFSKDYDTFCKQLKDKNKFVNLFMFIAELYKLDMIEMVLIKKYLMILINKITKSKDIQSLEMDTNASCIKELLFLCEDKNLYEVAYIKFKPMQTDKRYKAKFRFILMDINEKYEKNYL